LARDHGEFRDPSTAKFVQSDEDPWLEALQDHVVGALNPPVCLGVCHGCPIHADMVIIKAMNNISKEEHHLLRFDSLDWPSESPMFGVGN
jgi:hypothetical protein